VDDLDIRYAVNEDESYLRGWLHAPGMLHWFPVGNEKELDNGAKVWMAYSRFSASLTAVKGGTPVGMATLFLMPYRKVAHHCFFKLIVDPKYQRQGIGEALLKNLMHLARNYFRLELIHIEVFEGNPLIHLLEKMGFRRYAYQEDYVKEGETYMARALYEKELI
jgi:putative acetyltransferase